MEKILANYLSELNQVLAILSFIIGVVFFVTSAFEKDQFRINLKIAGALIVSSLSFMINSAGIYALTIFIIATFITKLDFLENLAAIFWGRKEYWDYKKSILVPASDNEIKEEKGESHIETKEKDAKMNFMVSEDSLQLNAFKDLEETGLFGIEKIQRNVKLEIEINNQKRKWLYDGLISTSSCTFIIEVKTSFSEQLKMLFKIRMGNLRRHYEINGIDKTIYGILIIPSHLIDKNFLSPRVGILRYDQQNHKFENLDNIKNWIQNIND